MTRKERRAKAAEIMDKYPVEEEPSEEAAAETSEAATAEGAPEETPEDEAAAVTEEAAAEGSETPPEEPEEPLKPPEEASEAGTEGAAQALQEELEALRQENEDLKRAIQESGEKSAATIAAIGTADAAAATEGAAAAAAYPRLDLSQVLYGSPDEQQQAADRYTQELIDAIMEKQKPDMAAYAEAKNYMANADAIRVLENMEELKGFGDMRPRLDAMIQGHTILSNAQNPLERYITAYLIQKGIDAAEQEGKEPTVEELMELYHGNTGFRDAIEQERAEALSERKDLPPTPKSAGLSSAEAYTPETPKNLKEARMMARKAWR